MKQLLHVRKQGVLPASPEGVLTGCLRGSGAGKGCCGQVWRRGKLRMRSLCTGPLFPQLWRTLTPELYDRKDLRGINSRRQSSWAPTSVGIGSHLWSPHALKFLVPSAMRSQMKAETRMYLYLQVLPPTIQYSLE